jgi:predicted CopG family antitoxin
VATITIRITDDAYKALKAEKKRDGKSFSDVILRKFQKDNPAAIKAIFIELGPDPEFADANQKSRPRPPQEFQNKF